MTEATSGEKKAPDAPSAENSPQAVPGQQPVAADTQNDVAKVQGKESDVVKQDTVKKDGASPSPKTEEVVGTVSYSFPNFLSELSKYEPSQSLRGEPVKVGDYEWNLYIFPRGNGTHNHLSFYAEVANLDKYAPGWQRYARIKFMLANADPLKSKVEESASTFSAKCRDWGYTKFISLDAITEDSGFLQDGALTLTAQVTYCEDPVERRRRWDSRKETGMVGLVNQGATCYMNSLLQNLFQITKLRKAVYDLEPTADADKNVGLALQKVFYGMQFSPKAVDTKQLLDSFGWDSRDSFVQHDVQEFNRVLCDKLELKMKGTSVENTIKELFVGRMKNYIQCVHVDYTSAREEPFYDISLMVKGCATVYDSFDKYVEEEKLEGDNRYRAEGHGLQEAKKGITFMMFPAVLNLHMKRFEYDFMADTLMKINDKIVFPEDLDLSRYLSKDAPEQPAPKYRLWGVLVHCGDIHGGHYYSFVRNTANGEWYRCDDDRVEPATDVEAMSDNYGTDVPSVGYQRRRSANAYYLTYVRVADESVIMRNMTTEDVPETVRAKFNEEFTREAKVKEDSEKKKKDDSTHVTTHMFTEDDILSYSGIDLGLVPRHNTRSMKVPTNCTCRELYERVSDFFSKERNTTIKPAGIALFNTYKRQNGTTRIEDLVPLDEFDIGPLYSRQLSLGLFVVFGADFKKYYADREKDREKERFEHQDQKKSLFVSDPSSFHALIFVKYYDALTPNAGHTGQLRSCGYVYVHNKKASDVIIQHLVPDMLKKCGVKKTKEQIKAIDVYEEIRADNDMVNLVDPAQTLGNAEIGMGDILILQERTELAPGIYSSVKQYISYLKSFVEVEFRHVGKKNEPGIMLHLSTATEYLQVAKALSERVKHPADKIKLDPPKSAYVYPNTPLTKRPLSNFITWMAGRPSCVMYDLLRDRTVHDLENMIDVSILWVDERNYEKKVYEVHVLKTAHVTDIMQALLKVLSSEKEENNQNIPDVSSYLPQLETNGWKCCEPRESPTDDDKELEEQGGLMHSGRSPQLTWGHKPSRFVRLIETRYRNTFSRVLRGPECVRADWTKPNSEYTLVAGHVPCDELCWWLGVPQAEGGKNAASEPFTRITGGTWWLGNGDEMSEELPSNLTSDYLEFWKANLAYKPKVVIPRSPSTPAVSDMALNSPVSDEKTKEKDAKKPKDAKKKDSKKSEETKPKAAPTPPVGSKPAKPVTTERPRAIDTRSPPQGVQTLSPNTPDSASVISAEEAEKQDKRLSMHYGYEVSADDCETTGRKKVLWVHHVDLPAAQDDRTNMFGSPLSVVVYSVDKFGDLKERLRVRVGMEDSPYKYRREWTLVKYNQTSKTATPLVDETQVEAVEPFTLSLPTDEIVAVKHKNMRSGESRYKEKALVINP